MSVPEVSIRAALAVGFAAGAVYMWVTETPMLPYQEFITTSVVTYYFAARTLEPNKPAPPEPLKPPVNIDDVDLLNRSIKP